MKSPAKSLSAIIIVTVLSCVHYSCSCSNCGKKEEAVVPASVLQSANNFIISKTGSEFFNSYITADFAKTKHSPPYYEMAYNLFIPQKPYVNNSITFSVDSTGDVVESRDIIGIPTCVKNPSLCNWQVDKESAVAIAEEGRLEKGIKDWKVGFIWNPERQIYVWHILTTIREFQGDFGYRGSGKEMLIDPVNGEVLALNDWRIN